jgi:cytochrome c peroxidase
MHRNQFASLEEVVDWIAQGGTPNPHLDPLVRKLDLSAEERGQLVAFLQSLSGPSTPVALGRMPE